MLTPSQYAWRELGKEPVMRMLRRRANMHKPPSFSNADKLAQAGYPAKSPAEMAGSMPLFDAPPAPAQAHSETSKAAARSVKSTRGWIMQRVLDAIRGAGGNGLTDEEIQQMLNLQGNTERPARVALVQQGVVVDSGNKGRTAAGRSAVLWVARTGIQG